VCVCVYVCIYIYIYIYIYIHINIYIFVGTELLRVNPVCCDLGVGRERGSRR